MLGPVSISLPTIVVELVIFLATVWLMEWLVFAPIRRAWAERDRSIHEGLEASSRSREEAEKARGQVREILMNARRQAQQRIDQTTAEGSQLRDQLVARATEEFRRLVDQARQEITREREQSARALRDRIIDLAIAAASQVTGQSYPRQEVRELAAAVIEREGLA